MSPEGHVLNQAGTGPLRRSDLVGLDGETTAYVCGSRQSGELVCYALGMDSAEPLWQMTLGPDLAYAGGAIASDRVYVATQEGALFALGDGD
jgi:outer membrane protein assembly factor BamB